jgi:hypothetical protein
MAIKQSFVVLGVASIIIGGLLILENFGILSGIHNLWPVFPLILGIGFWFLFFGKRKIDKVLAGIGTFLICLSAFFFYLNFTSWYKLSFLWPLFIGFAGVSFISGGLFSKLKIVTYIGIGLILLSAIFILIFSVDIKLWPVSLILFGGSIVIIILNDRRRK